MSRFEPSGANGNWFKVGCSRYGGNGDETISDSVHYQDPAASSSLLEWIPLQLLQHGCHTRCPSVIRTGETCSVALNRFDFIDVAFERKLIARSTIHYRPCRNFLSPEFTKKTSRGKYPYSVHTWISLKHSVGLVERSLHAKTQLDPSNHFNRTPTCDRHRHRQTDGHRAIASTRASTASRG